MLGYPPLGILLFVTMVGLGVPILFGEAIARRPSGRRLIGGLVRLGTAVVFIVAAAMAAPRALRESNLLYPDEPAYNTALFEWAAATPDSSRFLTPPELTGFRVRAGRAIVADWKSTPILPDELILWYRRLQEISGLLDVRSLEDAAAGYRAIPETRLERLSERFRIDYAVLPKGAAPWARRWVVYRNEAYQVVDVRSFVTARRLARSGAAPERPSP
jgi:hypothetical protein